MDATTRCRSSKAASFFDEHSDAPTEADSVEDADALVEDIVGSRNEGVVVEKFLHPPPEASVGVDEVVEGADDAFFVDESVGDEYERLGSSISIWRWG